MPKDIKNMINELYELDPELKKYESEIMKIVEKFTNNKPDSGFDQEFASRLKAEIMSEINNIKKAEQHGSFSVWLPRFSFALSGAAITLIAVFSLPLLKDKPLPDLSLAPDNKLVFAPEVSDLPPGAFGELASDAGNLAAGSEESAKVQSAPLGLGEAAGLGGGGYGAGSSVSSKMILPEIVAYDFVYQGGEFTLPGSSGKVYKKEKKPIDIKALAASKLNLGGLIDASQFSRLGVESLNLTENKDYGHNIYINAREGIINIGTNWEKWPRPDANCREEKCFEASRLRIDDIPEDEKIIRIAGQFIEKFGINLDNYGQPQVDKYWKRQTANGIDEREIYISDEIAVIYPMKIEGREVVNESGGAYGLRVGVNIRHDKVASLNNLQLNDFQASEYSLVTDKDRILELARGGGAYPFYNSPEAVRKIEVSLGTPEFRLISIWRYNDEAQTSEEYYIPSLVFPVKEISDANRYFYREAVVVPLVEDYLPQEEPVVRPMPLLRDAPGASIQEEPAAVREESGQDE